MGNLQSATLIASPRWCFHSDADVSPKQPAVLITIFLGASQIVLSGVYAWKTQIYTVHCYLPSTAWHSLLWQMLYKVDFI